MDAADGRNLQLLAGGVGGFGNIDGTGAAARFYNLSGVAADGAGNLFIADSTSGTIRKMVVSSGVVTTLAGAAGLTGTTDGTGNLARFNFPQSVAADGAGNLFVADSGNNVIRKVVVSTGVVSTLAGAAGMTGSADGTGNLAQFNFPEGVAADGAGNLFIADQRNSTIRQVVVSTGVVTTLAGAAGMIGSTNGNGNAARFSDPHGIAVDGAGNLFVADGDNRTIRQVVVSTREVTTLAGLTGTGPSMDGIGSAARFTYPAGVALDGAGKLFVGDNGQAIRQVVVSTAAVTTVAGAVATGGIAEGNGGTARFNNPRSLAVDNAGIVLIVDHGNSTIRKVVVSTGVVTTLAGSPGTTGSADGTGAGRFNFPRGVATDGAGNLFVADSGNSTIRKVVVPPGAVTTLAGAAGVWGSTDGAGNVARFLSPDCVALDGAGNLFITDSGNHMIRKMVVSTGVVSTLAGAAGMMGSTDGNGNAARFNAPHGVVADGAGNLFITDSGNHTIRKVVVSTGVVTTLTGTAGVKGSADGTGSVARFNSPQGLAFDGAGNLFVADTNNHTIRKIVLASAAVSTVVGVAGMAGIKFGSLPGGLNEPADVAILPDGTLIIANSGENNLLIVR